MAPVGCLLWHADDMQSRFKVERGAEARRSDTIGHITEAISKTDTRGSGEQVQWQLLGRSDLRLHRLAPPTASPRPPK